MPAPTTTTLTWTPSSASALTHLAAASAGSPLYSLPDLNRSRRWKRTLARLIDPATSSGGGGGGGGVPIAVDIEFHSRRTAGEAEDDEEAAPVPAAPRRSGAGDEDLAYELHYVLDGRGRLSSRPLDGRGRGPRVAAGDSVASFAGRAALRPVGGGRGGGAARSLQPGTPRQQLPWWSLATLTVTMPRDASAEAARAAVRAAAARLRGARRIGNGGGLLSAADAAAAVSGARSRSLRAGGSSSSGGDSEVPSSSSSCCGKKRTTSKAQKKMKQGKGKGQRRQQQLSSSASSAAPASPLPLPPPPSSRPAATTLRRNRPLSRRLSALPAFRLKDQTNRLAVAFDPFSHGNVGFTAGIEVFLPGHVTPRHSHAGGVHELFFVLSGSGVGVVQEVRRESESDEEENEDEDEEEGSKGRGGRKFTELPLNPGVAALFLPMQLHAIDVPADSESPLVCLEVMAPDDRFAELVMGEGQRTGGLTAEELCALAAVGCGG